MIRGLTLYQPLASFVATGDKRIETRDWSTTYRDVLAIHAAANEPHTWRLKYYGTQPYVSLLQREFGTPFTRSQLPRGAIVAICVLDACCSTGNAPGMRQMFDRYAQDREIERALGDYRMDRYAFGLKHIFKLPTPVDCPGARKLWRLNDSACEAVFEQLCDAIKMRDESAIPYGLKTLITLNEVMTRAEIAPRSPV